MNTRQAVLAQCKHVRSTCLAVVVAVHHDMNHVLGPVGDGLKGP